MLSAVAPYMEVKDLQASFKHQTKGRTAKSCTKYEVTKTKIHQKVYGAVFNAPVSGPVKRVCTSVEDIAFLLEFIHCSEAVERSPNRTASCEGKREAG